VAAGRAVLVREIVVTAVVGTARRHRIAHGVGYARRVGLI
jgi:hypothetical protein